MAAEAFVGIKFGAGGMVDSEKLDLVEIAPSHDLDGMTLVQAERLICNFIGATVRAWYFD